MVNISFYIKNFRWLYIVFILTFCSAFGQTFFISLYSAEIRQAFNLSHGEWGLIYSIATLSSAILILFVGGYADKLSAKMMSSIVIFGLMAFVFGMAINSSFIFLIFIILGLRFFGQGMLGHLSMVYCGKWFSKNRGKAVAVANSGYTLAEASLPTIFVILIGIFVWERTWFIAFIICVIILLSILIFLTVERDKKDSGNAEITQTGMNNKSWTRNEMLKNWVFWLALPGLMTSPMFTTTLFFHQVHLVNVKGWEMSEFVILIPFYSFTSLLSLYIFGYLVDRLNTKNILPFFLLPLILGFTTLASANSYLTLILVFVFLGTMQGAYSVVYGTFFPEFFGTKNLASIRTVGLAVMVLSSAIGPVLSGYFIDLGYEIDAQFMFMSFFAIFASILFMFVSYGTKISKLS